MADITLSTAVRNNLLSLQRTADMLGKTQQRLATGLKVNSALDDPTAYFTASSLNSRAGDLNRLLDSVGQALQTIRAADDGIKAITKLVESTQASARQALQSPTASTTYELSIEGAAIGADEAATVTGSVAFANDTAVDNATGTMTIEGPNGSATIDFDSLTTQVGLDAALASAATATGLTISRNSGDEIEITAADNTTSFTVTGSGGGVAAGTHGPTFADFGDLDGQSMTIQVGTTNNVINFGTGAGEVSNSTQLAAALNAIGGGVSAELDGGVVTISSTSNVSVTLSDDDGGDVLGHFGLTAGTTEPDATTTPNAQRDSLEAQFNNLRTQIDELAADAHYSGNNLLNGGNLTVIFNEDGSSSLSIEGVTFNAEGLGISEVQSGAFQDNDNVNASLAELDTAIASLRQQASTFGSNLSVVEIRQDFTKNLINTLETGAANLTLADTNEEGANLLALQTRQQLSSVALSLASQADQNVLRLF